MNRELPYDAFLRTVKENSDVGHVFLLGAGASISSGIKSAEDCIWEWKKNIFISNNPSLTNQYKDYQTDAVQKSIQRWLDNEGNYPVLNSPEEYSFYANRAYPIDDIRRKYFENICRGKEPYIGYKLLCLLSEYGMLKSIFTTNFDGLVERAAHQMGVTPISVSLDTPDRIHRAANSNELLYVALHGDFKYGPLKNTGKELDSQHDTFVEALRQHLYDKHLIVIGYSGRDISLMNALKMAYSQKGAGMLFWCGYGYDPNPEVTDLLNTIQQTGRQGYFIPTEGFDSTLIHISKTCFEGSPEFSTKVTKVLEENQQEKHIKTSFSMNVKYTHSIIKSNLFPIMLPREVFQLDVKFNVDEKIWATIKNIIGERKIIAVPLKKLVYAFGTQSSLHEAFNNRLEGDIKRTPVSIKEIRDGSVFKNLFLRTIIKGFCTLYKLETDGFEKIWKSSDGKIITYGKDNTEIKIYDAIKLGLFFDRSINNEKPYAFLSIQPTFYLKSQTEISKEIKFEIGRKYYADLLSSKPNIKFDEQIEKWKAILFPEKKRLEFEYPLQSGTGFKFAIGQETMHINLMKSGSNYGSITFPKEFNQRTLLHNGIQYLEPQLEFSGKDIGKVTNDFHPMRGLIRNKPYDYSLNGNVFESEINLGVICPASNSSSLSVFLNRLNQNQSAGNFNPDYLMDYPGFYGTYGIPLNIPAQQSDLWQNCSLPDMSDNLIQSATALADNIKRCIDRLETTNKKLVIVIFIPTSWNYITKVDENHEKFDLHDYIKAYAAQKQIATQFIQEKTLSDNLICQINWWLSLSFYVKAQRTPWILSGLESETAFVGIGYSVNHKRDKNKIVLGCSHIYNSNGQGLKYRLSRVDDCYFDKQNNPYLSYKDAYKFGTLIRELFYKSMGEIPKRVVIHKRTHFKKDEINGITDSLRKSGIQQVDLIEINYEDNARFISLAIKDEQLKPHPFPLSRGTCFLLDHSTALLWTHGIVPSIKEGYRSYFQGGKNIPIPLVVKKHYGESNISTLATEILGLTKMNWNSFDLYSKLPSTIETSNEIARIGWLLSRFEGKTYDYRNFM